MSNSHRLALIALPSDLSFLYLFLVCSADNFVALGRLERILYMNDYTRCFTQLNTHGPCHWGALAVCHRASNKVSCLMAMLLL